MIERVASWPGRTPVQALKEALGVEEIPQMVPNEEVNAPLQTAA